MTLTLDTAPNAPSYSNPDTFEQDTSAFLAWMKAIRNQLSGQVPEVSDLVPISNANGLYVRIPGGIQLCWHTLNSSSTTDTTWSFPAAFINSASITPLIIPLTGALGLQEPHVATLGTGALTFHTTNGSARIAVGCRLFAIGRHL